jgi:Nif-specific regulatory protein
VPEQILKVLRRMVAHEESVRPSSVAEVRSHMKASDWPGVAARSISIRPLTECGLVPRRNVARLLHSAIVRAQGGLGHVLALVGPEGTGKTFAAKAAEVEARASGFGFVSCCRSGPSGDRATLSDELHALLRDSESMSAVHADAACIDESNRQEHVSASGSISQSLLLYADNADELSKEDLVVLVDAVRATAEQGASSLLVLACRELPVDLLQVKGVDLVASAAAARKNGIGIIPVYVRRLGNLSRGEVARLFADTTLRSPSPDLVDWMVRRTAGDPLFIRELTGQLATHEHLRESSEGLRLEPEMESAALPVSVMSVLRERVRGLTGDQLRVAQIASLGPGITLDVISHITGVVAERVQELIGDLARSGILSTEGLNSEQVFGHEMLRDAIYEAIPAPKRRRLHEDVAATWDSSQRPPSSVSSRDAVLAWHLHRGGQPNAATAHALRCAAAMTRDGRSDESLPYLHILEMLPTESIRAVDGAQETLLDIARDYWRLGRASRCVRVCELGMALVGSSGCPNSPAALEFKTLLSRAYVLSGDLGEAERILRDALAEAEQLEHPASLVKAYYSLCMVCQMSGRLREMLGFSTSCLATAELSGNPTLIRLAYGARGNALIAVGEWKESIEWYRDYMEISGGVEDRKGLAMISGNLGRAYLYLGEWLPADDYFEKSLALAREANCEYSLGLSLCNSAILRMRMGALGEAAERFREAIVRAGVASDDCGLASTLSDLGELEHVRGNDQSALELFARSEELMEQAGTVDDLPELQRRKAESLMSTGRCAAAQELAEVARNDAEKMGNRLEAANCLRVLGQLAPDSDEAIRLLEDAVERLRALGAPYELNQTLQVLGRVHLGAGLHDAAVERLTEARDGFKRLGARRDARRAQEELAAATGRITPGPGKLPDERERLAALYASSHSLSSAPSVEALVQDLSDIAAAAMPADTVAAVLLTPGHEPALALSSLCESRAGDDDILSLVSAALSELHERDAHVLLADPDTATPILAPFLKSGGVRHLALVPMSSGERMVGALYLDYRMRDGEFSEGDVRFLRALAVQAATLIENAQLRSKLTDEVESLRWVVDGRHKFASIVGQSLRMQQLFSTLEKVARTSVTVLIEGESGTGKELVARAVHVNGPRKNERFVAQNCAALPEQLLESELFGHVRGAFTGAHRDKQGLFEAADDGTFFLDEIADMSPSLQVKLLRVLQEGEIRRVGATDHIDVDVRIIAATNKRLRDEVKAGRFREDLFYRLNVVGVEMPPLRDRRDDVPLLAQHFLNRFCEAGGEPERGFSDRAMDLLVNYDWPGNVRELENEIERAVALSAVGATITAECLSDRIRSVQIAIHPPKPGTRLSLKSMVEDVEKRVILQLLEENRWNKSRTAEALGLSRQGLLKKIGRFGLTREKE